MPVGEISDREPLAASRPKRERLIAIYIAILAAMLAVATVAGDNAAKDAAKANLDAANTWAFFQAKNGRRTAYRIAAEALEMRLADTPPPPATLRARIEQRLAFYRKEIAELTSEPERGEGLDELWVKGKRLEAIREAALQRDPYFDYAQALLQIAIVLASVAIITGGSFSLQVSALVAAAGIVCLVNAFTMAFDLSSIMEVDAFRLQKIQQILTENARPK